MRLQKRIPSGREKDEEAVKLLARLREKLYCDNSSVARRTAFNLSWMQEDGLDVLKEALFSNGTRTTKSAAAYGLRNMHGRMKNMARAVLDEGMESSNRDTRKVSKNAIDLLEGKPPKKPFRRKYEGRRRPGRFEIREVSNRSGIRKRGSSSRPEHLPPNRRNSNR